MDYSKLSDFEVNKKVALEMGYPVRGKQNFADDGLSPVMLEPGYGGPFDPCKNPEQAWPIIVENRISISAEAEYEGNQWMAYCVDSNDDIHELNINPLRAAMIVFLMMQEKRDA